MTFYGYERPDGRVGVRNEIWVLPTVGCVNDVAKALVRENQDLVTGSIDGLYAFPHPFGCSQTGADHAQTRKRRREEYRRHMGGTCQCGRSGFLNLSFFPGRAATLLYRSRLP